MLACLAACGGGGGAPARCDPTAPFGAPVSLALNTTFNDEGAHLSPDELTIYFSSDRAGTPDAYDLYVATRASRDDEFGAPTKLAGASSDTTSERRPTVSADGLRLYALGTDFPYDILTSTRADTSADFGPLTVESSLSAGSNDYNPYLSRTGVMWFTSDRDFGPGAIYRAAASGDSFATPVMQDVPMGGVTPVASDDELTMYFAYVDGTGTHAAVATRASADDPQFASPTPIASLASRNAWATWVSEDDCVLYYMEQTNQSTGYDLGYVMRGN